MSAVTTRVRGFAPWSPRSETLALLDQVRKVLHEYRDHLPLTIRQVFYRLVGAYGYAKTEAAYDRLCEHLNRARRAGLIPFKQIRDDGITFEEPHCWRDADELVQRFIDETEHFRLDRQEGQPTRLIFAVEAAGMVPQVRRVADPYGIPVQSSGGFDSLTAKHDLAERFAAWERIEVLHIGDHDPSGVHLFLSMAEDVEALAEGLDAATDIDFTRLAVIPRQIAALNLPTAPAKPTDRRSFTGETVQAEAIPPDVLAEIIREAITTRLDRAAYDAVLAAEADIRKRLREQIRPLLNGSEGESP
jgi:hypothetical protein